MRPLVPADAVVEEHKTLVDHSGADESQVDGGQLSEDGFLAGRTVDHREDHDAEPVDQAEPEQASNEGPAADGPHRYAVGRAAARVGAGPRPGPAIPVNGAEHVDPQLTHGSSRWSSRLEIEPERYAPGSTMLTSEAGPTHRPRAGPAAR